jgi:pullulanase/glycogen debranching enzyme
MTVGRRAAEEETSMFRGFIESPWRGLPAALIVLSAMLVAACGGGGGGGSVDLGAEPPEVTAAGFHGKGEAAQICDADFETVLDAVPATPPATVRIHYHRDDGNYAGWTTYVYNAPGEALGGWPGQAPMGSDTFGVYWDIPVASAEFNFIIVKNGGGEREPSNWSGNTGDQQQYWRVADGKELWKLSGDATQYTTNPLVTPDISSVRVHYARQDGNYAAWGVHIWPSSGIDTSRLKPGVVIDQWGAPVAFGDFNNYAAGASEIVFEIPVLNPQGDPSRKALEFIIHGFPPNENDKDGRNDNIRVAYAALTIAGGVGDVWLLQGDPTVYTAAPDTRRVSTTDARAVWLDKSLVQWPGMAAGGVFKLYHSASGQIRAEKDRPVTGADGAATLDVFGGTVPADVAERFKYVAPGVVLALRHANLGRLKNLLNRQLVLVQENAAGEVQNATTAQIAGALDDLYGSAAKEKHLGVTIHGGAARFRLWAPTAQKVTLCLYDSAAGKAVKADPMDKATSSGVWHATLGAGQRGRYYKYAVEVFVRGVGRVRNLVTDPYSLSLTTDSKRSFIVDLDHRALKPAGWDQSSAPPKVANQVDMTIYELHVRDFSIDDPTVSAANRGKYLAFTEGTSNGMKHLRALADAGLTDVHLLPVFDIATVPESGCVTPAIPNAAPDSDAQQAAIDAVRDQDCFNWGYDPYHYTAPEGSYATDPTDGAKRILEFRQMVKALHQAGLRVGMDVVYNHTTASGQKEKSVLDRIVPGYYHRLNASGGVETSTCCDNTATENLMMAKLMSDSVVTWAKHYKIDSFRFDLMAHQPRPVMEAIKARLVAETGREIQLIGEGWNFGEVADNARFEQASQLGLNGSGIGTFSDRARDHVRGGGPFDSGDSLVKNQGYISGLWYDDNGSGAGKTKTDLMWAADIIKSGLAGSIRSYKLTTHWDASKRLEELDYNGQPAGYVTQPQEVVNYVENHDNQTLFDIGAYKLPTGSSREDRARSQILGAAINAFSQGVTYFHAGIDTLRSKSMDRNSYDSGDWFNRLDWTYQDNNFGVGLPPAGDNGSNWSLIGPRLANALIKPTFDEIAWTRDAFRDLLRIRASSTLLRLRTADDIKSRLSFHNTGSTQVPTVLAGHVDGTGYAGAGFRELLYLVNVDKVAQAVTIDALKGKAFELHPVHVTGADRRPANDAHYDPGSGAFTVPPRTALVYVVK